MVLRLMRAAMARCRVCGWRRWCLERARISDPVLGRIQRYPSRRTGKARQL